jgi:hypothetical protein
MVNFFLLFLCLEHGLSAIVTSYSVGGFGNGASFAHQLHVAYATTIQAAGLVAPSPYYCSMGSRVREDTACRVNPYLIELTTSISYYTQSGSDNLVDPITSLSNDRAYLVSGTNDKFVHPRVVQQTEAFYRNFIHNDYKVITNYSIPAGHGWITDNYGGPCWSTNTPFIVNCGFDLAGDMLQHLFGTLNPRTTQNYENLKSFDQSHYGDVWQAGLSNRGWIYLPTYCVTNKGCQVIVMYHGCHQNYDIIGDIFIKQTGINEWAESNNIVVIYPQTISTSNNLPGCWDTWGMTGTNFSVQAGLQMKLVHGIALNPPYLNWSN